MKSSSTAKTIKEEEIYRKILLLGTGQTGKSTIRKQIQCIYGTGLSEDFRRNTAPYLFGNIVGGAQCILNRIEEKNENSDKLIDSQSIKAAQIIKDQGDDINELNDDIVESLLVLWKDKIFRKAYFERAKYQLDNCWVMFMEKLKDYPKWGGPGWIPSIDDCILARSRTTGLIEGRFTWENTNYIFYDVGGARNERKKWIHVFDDISAVAYIADLGCYDENLFEDADQNRLIASLELFEDLAMNKWLSNSKFFLIKLRVEGHLLNTTGLFPDAPNNRDVGEAIKWIESKYIELWNKYKKEELIIFIMNSMSPVSVQETFDVILKKIKKRLYPLSLSLSQ